MAGEYGFAAAISLGDGFGRVREKAVHGRGHFVGGVRPGKIALAEEVFSVLPGSGDEGNAAGQGLENANGGNAVQESVLGAGILLARDVHRKT